MSEKIKVACYCRVSTNSSDQKNSFENQKSYFLREISRHPNYELYKIYSDEGISGTRIFARDGKLENGERQRKGRIGFEEMLKDAGLKIQNIDSIHKDTGMRYEKYSTIPVENSKFKYIFTTSTSRFARNIEIASIINDLLDNEVYVNFVEERLSTENPIDIPRIQQRQIFDEDDSRIKSERVKRGMEESREKGRLFVNGNIYGYLYIKDSDDKDKSRLEIIENEAFVIRKIFEMYSQNLGTRRIAQYLEENNIVSRKGVTFSYSTIRAILNNIRYAGINVYNKYNRSGVFAPIQFSKLRKREEWDISESEKVPAIIELDLFNQCQQILESKKSHINNKGVNRGKGKFASLITVKNVGIHIIKHQLMAVSFLCVAQKRNTMSRLAIILILVMPK